jgi:CubicO group peptidase (beta-lactamase class C family)
MQKIKNYYFIILILLISILSLVFISCKQDPTTLRTYQIPENIENGLEIGTLEEVDIDRGLIEQGINDINRGKYGEVHSLLIYKDGKLVVEEYFEGHHYNYYEPNHHGELVTFTSSTVHALHSVTKSITSACIGIAVGNGSIQNVNQSIFDYLP